MNRKPRDLTRVVAFIETGFSRRCRALIDRARRDREWMIVLGLPGDGKSFAYRRYLIDHPVTKIGGISKTAVLGARVPQGGVSQNALMYRFGSRFGLALPGRPAAFFIMLVNWTIDGGVELIAVDDAHELAREPRKWLRSFHDSLQDPADPEREPIQTGVVLLGNHLRTDRMPLFKHRRYNQDVDWIQFERRLHFDLPLVQVDGLYAEEVGEALRGLEELYRPQFPELRLQPFAEAMFELLLDPAIDFATVKRVRMDSLVKVVLMALTAEAADGGWGRGIRGHLTIAIERLRLRPQELDQFAVPVDELDDVA